MHVSELSSLVSEKKFDQVEGAFKDALLEPEVRDGDQSEGEEGRHRGSP